MVSGNMDMQLAVQQITFTQHGIEHVAHINPVPFARGNLASVHYLENATTAKRLNYILKVSEQRNTEEETVKLRDFREHLGKDQPSGMNGQNAVDVLPDFFVPNPSVLGKRANGEVLTGLVLEYVDPATLLVQYLNRFQNPVQREHETWRIALRYLHLIRLLNNERYIINDRKYDDFYFNKLANEGKGRLVVLDWNVIQKVDEADNPQGVQERQDISLFMRIWLSFFGGSESDFRFDNPELSHLSCAGQWIFYEFLDPYHRKDQYEQRYLIDTAITPGVAAYLYDQVAELVGWFTASKEDLLKKLADERPKWKNANLQEQDVSKLEILWREGWSLADMLLRRYEYRTQHDSLAISLSEQELREIKADLENLRDLRQQAYANLNARVSANLRFTDLALKEIAELKGRFPSQENLLSRWEVFLQDIKDRVTSGYEVEAFQSFILQLQEKVTNLQAGTGERLESLQEWVAEQIALFPSDSVDGAFLRTLSEVLRAQSLLLANDDDAQVAWRSALSAYQVLGQQSTIIAQNYRELLAKSFGITTETLQRFADLPANAETAFTQDILTAIKKGNYDDAIRRYERLVSGLQGVDAPAAHFPAAYLNLLQQQVQVAYQAQALKRFVSYPEQLSEPGLRQILKLSLELLDYRSSVPHVTGDLENAWKKLTRDIDQVLKVIQKAMKKERPDTWEWDYNEVEQALYSQMAKLEEALGKE